MIKTRLFIFSVVLFLTCSLSTGVLLTCWSSGQHVLNATPFETTVEHVLISDQNQKISRLLDYTNDGSNLCIELDSLQSENLKILARSTYSR